MIPGYTSDFIGHPLPKDSMSAHGASHYTWARAPHHLNLALSRYRYLYLVASNSFQVVITLADLPLLTLFPRLSWASCGLFAGSPGRPFLRQVSEICTCSQLVGLKNFNWCFFLGSSQVGWS